jgi:hypothetical protein
MLTRQRGKSDMVDKSLLRLLWNMRFRRAAGGYRAKGHSRLIKKETADKLFVDGFVTERNDEIMLTEKGRLEIGLTSSAV